jgi:hypothetical protein
MASECLGDFLALLQAFGDVVRGNLPGKERAAQRFGPAVCSLPVPCFEIHS